MTHRGRTVLAIDCVLAGAESHRARPLNSVVRRHISEQMRYAFVPRADTEAAWLSRWGCGKQSVEARREIVGAPNVASFRDREGRAEIGASWVVPSNQSFERTGQRSTPPARPPAAQLNR